MHEKYKIPRDCCRALISAYGAHSVQVAQLGLETETLERIHPDLPQLKVQVLYGIRTEFSMKISDVVFRRLGISFLNQQKAKEVVAVVADVMAQELKWAQSTKENNIKETLTHIDDML